MAINFCEKCGTKAEQGAHFCCACGHKFDFTEDETVAESFADASVQESVYTPEEEIIADEPMQIQETPEPPAPAKIKKASYKAEVFILILSLICFAGSLLFFLGARTTVLDSIAIVHNLKYPDAHTDSGKIPELTADMAEEIINNSLWCFPYYHFESEGMLNINDYIIYDDMGYDVECYSVDGIETMDDYYVYFEKFATREYVEKYFSNDMFYIVKNSKLYFVPNVGMGWYPTSAPYLGIEKLDDETYYVFSSFWTEDELIIKYIDGAFKATDITPSEVFKAYTESGETVTVPELSGLTLDEAENRLKQAGLRLDRNNISYLEYALGDEDLNLIVDAKYKYKKVKPGSSVGVYIAVEDPEYYTRGAKDGETVPELTTEKSAEILNALNDSYMHFKEKGMLDEANAVQFDFSNYLSYPIKGIESEEEYKNYYKQYLTASALSWVSNYTVSNGRVYIVLFDRGDDSFHKDYMVIEKLDETTYYVLDTVYDRDYIMIYSDGNFKVSNMSVDVVRELYSEPDATVTIPDLSGMTLSEAEAELKNAGLRLDSNNITYVYSFLWDNSVVSAKNICKKVKSGTAVGVYMGKSYQY